MKKDYWSKIKPEESNPTTSNQKKDSDDECEVEALIAIEEEELAFIVIILGRINYECDWINNMDGDKGKL